MPDHGPGPTPGARSNGLDAARYVAVGDLDPRVAEALLGTLREVGIAAYLSPTPGTRGGYLELRLPSSPTDRLYVDESRADHAAGLLQAETEPVAAAVTGMPAPASGGDDISDVDVDTAWTQLLRSLQTDSAAPDVAPWPSAEDVDSEPSQPTQVQPRRADRVSPIVAELEEEHFVPPPAPPLPRLRPGTVGSLLAILGGLAILGFGLDDGDLTWLAVLALLAGAAGLVHQVRHGPPTDSGWDDGAVV